MLTTLYLARHGETEWNVIGRMQGRGNSSLTARGMEQARRLGQRLLDVELTAIYPSISPRAIQTAELARGRRAIPILPDADLCEIAVGPWEGLTGSEIEAGWGETFTHFWQAPHLYHPPAGGESFLQARARMAAAAGRIAAAHAGHAILIISHGVALKSLLAHYAGRPPEQLWTPPYLRSASLSVIALQDGVPQILLEGDTAHLPDAER